MGGKGRRPATLVPPPDPSPSTKRRASRISFLRDAVWSQRWLLPMLAFELIAYGLILPIATVTVSDYFAAQIVGHPINCDSFTKADKPQACITGATTAAMVTAIASGASAFVGFFLSPVIGSLSDVYGRKRFLVLSEILVAAQVVLFVMFALGKLSVWPFIVMQAVQTSLSSVSTALAWISDMVSPQNRAAAFGIVLGVFSLGIIIGPLLAGFLEQTTALYLAMACSCCAAVYSIVLLPESLPVELRKPFVTARANPAKAVSILFRTSLFRRLSLCVLFQTMCSNGIQNVLTFYLENEYNFNTKNLSFVLMLIGISGVIVQGGLIKPLTIWLGHKGLLLLGLSCTAVSNLMFVLVRIEWVLYLQLSVALSLGLVTFPAVSSIKSINVTPKEQGQVQGALYGVRQLAGGLGPITFSMIYKGFSKHGGDLPYFPQAPFALGVVLLLISIGFAISLPPVVPNLPVEQARFVARRRACSIPVYLPSTPKTPCRIPRRGSTGLFGTKLDFTASPGMGDGVSVDSPLLSQSAAASRHADLLEYGGSLAQCVDDVLAEVSPGRGGAGQGSGRSRDDTHIDSAAPVVPSLHRNRTVP